ncbi:aminodeoxychorismate lyase [Pseudoalteromonas sp. SSM20]|uniref:aminodeoxychorismate lyase n=1 Tax=Pseudoalteromonas sp. SSM20 TaxID=3139394 RepID=UPI003BA8E76E
MDITIINKNNPNTVPTNDRAFQYGDGFFTTIKVVDGEAQLLEEHVARLEQCSSRLFFDSINLTEIESKIKQVAQTQALAVVKVVVSRGQGGRGYQIPETQLPQVYISCLPFPENYLTIKNTGIELDTLETPLAINPLTAGLKTLNRLEQVLAKQELKQKGFNEGLLLNCNAEVIETTVANLLLLKNGELFSPCLKNSGIYGVYLAHLAKQLTITFKTLTLEDFYAADNVFCCNSLMGIVPITRIDNTDYDKDAALTYLSEIAL